MIGIISYIFINTLVFLTHLLLAHKWLKRKRRSMTEVYVAGILSATAQMIVTMVVLGLFFKLLRAPWIFWVNVAVSVILIAVAGGRIRDCRLMFADIGRWFAAVGRTIATDIVLFALFIISGILFLWLLFLGILLPPYSWDALVYHLGAVGYWMQDGYIGEHAVFKSNPMNMYPLNIELLFFWNTVFFRNDILVNCTQLFFIPLGILSIYLIGRNTGCRRRESMLAGMLFTSFPVVMHQAITCYIDVAFSIIFMAALSFLLRPRLEYSDAVYAALGFGLLLGSKGSAPVFILSAAVPALLYHSPYLWRSVGFKRLMGWLATGVILILLTGSWVYIRNWVEYDNPAYPYNIDIFGHRLFEGQYGLERLESEKLLGPSYEELKKRSPLGGIYYSWSDPLIRNVYDSRLGGFGPVLFILLLPCFMAALVISIARRDGRTFFTLVIIMVCFWFTPVGRFWVRYNIFVTAAFCISLAYVINLLRARRSAVLLRTITLLLVALSVFAGVRNTVVPPKYIKYFLKSPPRLWHSSQFAAEGFEPFIFRKIYQLAKPGTSIAYDWGFEYMFIYPLWNRDFSNRIVFVDDAEEGEWRRTIDMSGVDYLVTGAKSKGYRWARARPERFRIVAVGPKLSLFAILNQAGASSGKRYAEGQEVDDET